MSYESTAAGQATSYSYDSTNRLSSVSEPSGTTVSFRNVVGAMPNAVVESAIGYLCVLGGAVFAVFFAPLMGLNRRRVRDQRSRSQRAWLVAIVAVEGMGVGGILIGVALLRGKFDTPFGVLIGLGVVCVLLSLISLVVAAELEPQRRE